MLYKRVEQAIHTYYLECSETGRVAPMQKEVACFCAFDRLEVGVPSQCTVQAISCVSHAFNRQSSALRIHTTGSRREGCSSSHVSTDWEHPSRQLESISQNARKAWSELYLCIASQQHPCWPCPCWSASIRQYVNSSRSSLCSRLNRLFSAVAERHSSSRASVMARFFFLHFVAATRFFSLSTSCRL